ncbi:hypothetical protein JTB14_037449 [Gonioctena quinquepunctata]|nr:hypothetical protein JTB14_037449 [Gonioctena quinquepunctata]
MSQSQSHYYMMGKTIIFGWNLFEPLMASGPKKKMMERLLRDMQTIKLDVRSLELNNNKLNQYQQLDAQLRFKDYEELQKFNESLLEEVYFNKIVT